MDSPRPDSDRKPTSGPGPSDQKPDGEERRPPYPFPWLLVALLGVILVFFLFNDSPESIGSKVDYSFFRSQLEADNVESVIFYGEVLTGKWKKPPQDPEDEKKVLEPEFNTVLPLPAIQNDSITKELELRKVKQSAEKREIGGGQQLLLYMIGPLLIIGFFWFMMRRSAESMGPGACSVRTRAVPPRNFRRIANGPRSTTSPEWNRRSAN
ncbi:MAG TPA: ATP-dependent metallopeptidase FtsH/Yme1/Tma family protein [Planctomycetaceae bacterium]|nr:ATP-dependent metallopeptidase FtsH/Yme1/Tma family protein [Planctomycetaceae bacterium]